MKLTPQQVEKIAQLARLELSEKEKKMYAEQLSAVLDYVEQLNEVNTEGVEETCQVTGLEDVARADKPEPSKNANKLVSQFPERVGRLLRVKAVFNSEAD